jgi:hypothetical protein
MQAVQTANSGVGARNKRSVSGLFSSFSQRVPPWLTILICSTCVYSIQTDATRNCR